MTARPIRRWLVCLGVMLGLVLKATPTAQQCYLDISAYASGIVSGYDASGNGVVDYYGSGFDYSWCDGIECVHAYAIEGTIKQLPSQQVWDQVQGEGTEYSQSVGVTPGEYRVESLFYVGCWVCAQQVFVTQAAQIIQVPACNAEQNSILQEYVMRGIHNLSNRPTVTCGRFQGPVNSTYFAWDYELNGASPPRHGYAWLEEALLNGLDATRVGYGFPITGTGAFRCPDKNDSVGSSQPLSWHQYGRAADLVNHSSRPRTMEEWQDIVAAAQATGAQGVIEIFNNSIADPRSHVHVEWEP